MINLKKSIGQFFYKNFIKIDKKVRFLISTIILTFLMLLSTFFFFDKAVVFILLFVITSYLLTYFSLLEGVEQHEWLMLFIIPVLFTVVFYLFFFLFPVRWLSRLPFIILYAVSIYAILRTSNIFNVGVEKSLQLYRAAFSVNYFYHTITLFFLGSFLFSLKLYFWQNSIVVFLIVFIMALHFFWSIRLKLNIDREIIIYSLLVAAVLGEGITVISFYPLEITISSLILTASYYSLVGLIYAYLDQRLFKEVIREYVIVFIFVFFISVLTFIKW